MFWLKNITVIFGLLLTIFPHAYFSVPFSPKLEARQDTGCISNFAKIPYSNPTTITTNDSNVHSLPCEGSPVICLLSDDVKYNITHYVANGECVNGISSIWFYVYAKCEGYIWGGATSYELRKCLTN